MEKIQFQAELREKTGKGIARETRRTGFIPAILYGPGVEPILMKIVKKLAERTIIHLESHNVMADLILKKDGKDETIKTVVKEIQIEPVTREILHIDFYQLRMDKLIVMEIPVHLLGEPIGIEQGGVLEQELREIKIEALPKDIPDKIEVDISKLSIGDTLLVKDLSLPEKVRLIEEEERVIISILAPRKVEEVETEEEEVIETDAEGEPKIISEEKVEERRKDKEEKGGKDEEKEKKEPQEKKTK